MTPIHVYEQLAWLARSELPLPEGLAQLAASMRRPTVARLMQQLSAETQAGQTLAEAMRRHPQAFTPLQIALVEHGERNGTLAQALQQIADLAREERATVQRLREGIAYPLLATVIALWVGAFMVVFIMPKFAVIFTEMLAGEPLPPLTRLMLKLTDLLPPPVLLAGLIVITGATLWLMFGGERALRWLVTLVRYLPGARMVYRTHDYVRLVGVFAVYVRRGVPLTEAIDMAKLVIDHVRLRQRLEDWRQSLAAGQSPAVVIGTDQRIDPMLALTFRHAPEAELGAALERLQATLRERATWLQRRMVTIWIGLVIFGTSLFVGATILAMFMPLIKLIDSLGGGGG